MRNTLFTILMLLLLSGAVPTYSNSVIDKNFHLESELFKPSYPYDKIGSFFNLMNFKVTTSILLSIEDYEKLKSLSIGRTTATNKFGAKNFVKTIVCSNSALDTLKSTKRFSKILEVLKKYE